MFLATLLLAAVSQDVPPIITATGTEYRVEGGRLTRRSPRGALELDCTDPEGTGTVLGLAAHPAGTLFVAAARGLFVTSDEVQVLDPMTLREGVPPGVPVGVSIADEQRLWVCTDQAFGCVDTRQGFGRTFGPEDGLPPGPYQGMRAGASGEVWVLTGAGLVTYTPGEGPAPTLSVTRAARAPFVPGQPVEVGPDGTLAFELTGEGLGGVTFRYRMRGHHLWRSLASGESVAGLEPGEHELILVALDRELRRSAEVPVVVRVPYPEALDAAVLLPLVFGACAAVLAAFLLGARRAGGGRARYGRALLSSLVACAVGLQLVAAVFPHGRSWPFVGFTMYSERSVRGDLSYKMTLELRRPNGAVSKVEPFDAGYGLFEFRQTLSERIHGTTAMRQAFLSRLRERHGAVAGYRILDQRWRLTSDGPIEVAPTVLAVHPPELMRGLPL